jgi:SAM-dependent MidA family methyltransferase
MTKNSLEQQLQARIRASGPVTYREFVETALFDPRGGYYRNGKPDHRDFLTSPEVHSVFGEAIARYTLRLADMVDEERFSLLELGGGVGRLGRAIVEALPATRLESYIILDKARAGESEGSIKWIGTVEHLPAFDGFTVVVANEFFDALPFHRVVRLNGCLKEIYLDFEDGFVDIPLPLSPNLTAYLETYPLFLNEQQTLEVTPALQAIGSALTEKVRRGVMLVFDYGYHLEDIAYGGHFDGTMVSYRNYVMSPDVFSVIGEKDISHHVNFDHLTAIFAKAGWKKGGETVQYRFLNAIGMANVIGSLSDLERRAARMLLDPDGMGSTFRVLGLSNCGITELPGF